VGKRSVSSRRRESRQTPGWRNLSAVPGVLLLAQTLRVFCGGAGLLGQFVCDGGDDDGVIQNP